MQGTAGSLLDRLHARDRALFSRLLLTPCVSARGQFALRLLTHLGGTRVSLALAVLPFARGSSGIPAGRLAAASLAISHLGVQVIKRCVGRPRPSRATSARALVLEPDHLSFPSGHAAAAMAIAASYAIAAPITALPGITLAVLVGVSRVCLGVHYPGDVLAGQLMAIVTVVLLRTGGL